MTLRILADDLTGALDCAAAFCGQAPFPVFLNPPPRLEVGSAALDLHCRDVGETAAVTAMLGALEFLTSGDIAFLKIDSLLRGHEAAGLAALWRTGRFRHCILAPAFPSQGRITRAGRQWAKSVDGEWRPVPTDLRRDLAERGVHDIEVLDAATDEELRALVVRGRALPGPRLWCGSAGLALAMASQPAPAVDGLCGPLLTIIGSRHPATQGQLDHLFSNLGVPSLLLQGDADEPARVASSLAGTGVVVQASIPSGAAPELAAARIGSVLRALLPRLAPPATLLASGGETLREICDILSVDRLDVVGAVEAGIPVSRIVGGRWGGVTIVSKSGGFGAVDILTRLHRMMKSFDAR